MQRMQRASSQGSRPPRRGKLHKRRRATVVHKDEVVNEADEPRLVVAEVERRCEGSRGSKARARALHREADVLYCRY